MAEGWICPSCKRGVAPTEKTCDHGVPWAISATLRRPEECLCPPFTICSNAACPRLPKAISAGS